MRSWPLWRSQGFNATLRFKSVSKEIGVQNNVTTFMNAPQYLKPSTIAMDSLNVYNGLIRTPISRL